MIDESYADIDDFNVPALFEIQDISPSAYLTCMCNLFWQVGMVILVDIQQLQVILLILISCNLIGPRKTFNQHQRGDSCYVPQKNIIQKISTRTISTGRAYKKNCKDYKKLILHLPNFSNNKLLYMVILLLPFAKCLFSVNKCLIRKGQ